MSNFKKTDLEKSFSGWLNRMTGETVKVTDKNKMENIKTHPFEIYEVQVNRWNLLKKTQTQYRWRIRANNGKIVDASTESFVNRVDCEYNAKCSAKSIMKHFEEL